MLACLTPSASPIDPAGALILLPLPSRKRARLLCAGIQPLYPSSDFETITSLSISASSAPA